MEKKGQELLEKGQDSGHASRSCGGSRCGVLSTLNALNAEVGSVPGAPGRRSLE